MWEITSRVLVRGRRQEQQWSMGGWIDVVRGKDRSYRECSVVGGQWRKRRAPRLGYERFVLRRSRAELRRSRVRCGWRREECKRSRAECRRCSGRVIGRGGGGGKKRVRIYW
jgi:hypothetical protein